MSALPRLLSLALVSVLAMQMLADPISRLSGGYALQIDSAYAQSNLPPVPAKWPHPTLQLGTFDSPGGAAAMKATAPFGFRYQYLSGGVNTGNGWATWNSDGHFVTHYVRDSVNNGITPVFTYYMIYQSAPGGGSEGDSVSTNLRNASTMAAYFNDLKLFFQRAGSFSQVVVLHVEPDMWGYMQQRAGGDDATTVPVQVSATGLPELAGLPNNAVGLAQAIKKLRDTYATNVLLAYHLSVWGTGTDIQYSDPPNSTVESLATRAANFYLSLNTNFDLAFSEFTDRDAGFKQYVYGDGGASWWNAEDFRRHTLFLSKFVSVSHERVVLWQIPFGNTKMRAMNNTWNHYQDNRVEWLLDDSTRAHLAEYLNAGVIAFLFGRGASGTTCPCDAAGDGITNPEPINGNVGVSLNADDDGGFFDTKAGAYYSTGSLPLPSGAAEDACLVNTLAASTSRLAASTSPESTAAVAAATTSAMGLAGPTRSSRLDPTHFRKLRDDVLARSPGGQRYITLYNTHSPEVVRLVLADPALRAATVSGLLLWQADLAALASGRGGGVTISDEQVRAVESVLDRLEAVGSSELRRAIQHERQTQPPGRFKGVKLDRALAEVTAGAKR